MDLFGQDIRISRSKEKKMNRIFIHHVNVDERFMLNGQEIHLGDRIEALLYDDNRRPSLYQGTVTTAADVRAAGSRLWVKFEGFYDFTLDYLMGCSVPTQFA